MRENCFYRILMFAPAFPPFANPEAIVNGKLALSFLRAGWHVDIISRNFAEEWKGYNYGSAWIEPWLPLKEHTHVVHYASLGSVHRVAETLWAGISLGHPVAGCRWALQAVKLATRLNRENRYDVILSRSLPDFAHIPALALSTRAGIPWIANWNDPSGDKMPPPYGRGSSTKLGFFQERLLRHAARSANWITFPSDRLRSYICEYLQVGSKEKSGTVPHPGMLVKFEEQKRVDDCFKICHAGKLYAGRDPEVFLLGLKTFMQRSRLKMKVEVCLVGLEEVEIERSARKLGLDGIIKYQGSMSYFDTLSLLNSSDVLLIIEGQHTEGIFFPSKFVDYVQVGKPVLALSPKNSVVNDIISVHGGGIVADCTSVEEVAEGLRLLYAAWTTGRLQTLYGSRALYKLFSPEVIVEKYRYIFSTLGL
jgi:glycosyltransferase involved in cell wall biosynthesis